ncbi:MAG: ATP-binding cassette domain-containing protein, partial [Pseudomonadota bacterium]
MSSDPILEIRNLTIELPKAADRAYAVENVSLSLRRGELLCVVGESGSGKSVMTSAIMNDVAPQLTISSGEVIFDGMDMLRLPQAKLNEIRGARISMIYQEPMAALNPAVKIGKQVDEVFELHRPDIAPKDRRAETLDLLEQM